MNHFEAGSNCQVFNGSVTGCVFAMPGSTVTQQAGASESRSSNSSEGGCDVPTLVTSVEVKSAAIPIPEVLLKSELWQRLIDAGLVDSDGQPTVSRPEAALVAEMLSVRLGIAHKWKLFEGLWHRKNMRGDYNTALEQRKSLRFQEKLKNVLD